MYRRPERDKIGPPPDPDPAWLSPKLTWAHSGRRKSLLLFVAFVRPDPPRRAHFVGGVTYLSQCGNRDAG
jgi:hypothetical protein